MGLENLRKISHFYLIYKLWNQLNRRRRIQLLILIGSLVINGIAEFVSFASVIPFLTIITEPNGIIKNEYLNWIFSLFRLTSYNQIVLAITIIFIITILTSASIRILNLWLITKVSAEIGTDLSVSIYNKLLHQPYTYHLNKNSSELSSAITFEVNRTTEYILLCLQFLAGVFLMSFLLLGFMSFNWYIGTPTIFTYILIYLIFTLSFKYRLTKNSSLIVKHTENQLKSVNNGLSAVRDVLLDGNQKEYIKNFKASDYPLRSLLAQRYFLGVMPRFVLEAIGIVLIAFLSIYLVMNGYSNTFIITLLGGVAIISQKLLPSMQLCYNAWSNLTNTKSSVMKVLESLQLTIEEKYFKKCNKLPFSNKIEIKDVSFKFNNHNSFSLKDINLVIKKGQRVGIVGQTGSGKSTLVNILMGLLEPSSGEIYVDNLSIYSKRNKNRSISWQKCLAHVPQNIYLSDQTFAENIAFGLPKSEINLNRVRKVAKIALISTLIESYTKGYQTSVGERGVRLSGGQKQRIGLARALYKDTKILILDEATSALDNKTEDNIMKAINNLSKDITIIMIAHRISTLSECDQIIEIKSGSILRNSKI